MFAAHRFSSSLQQHPRTNNNGSLQHGSPGVSNPRDGQSATPPENLQENLGHQQPIGQQQPIFGQQQPFGQQPFGQQQPGFVPVQQQPGFLPVQQPFEPFGQQPFGQQQPGFAQEPGFAPVQQPGFAPVQQQPFHPGSSPNFHEDTLMQARNIVRVRNQAELDTRSIELHEANHDDYVDKHLHDNLLEEFETLYKEQQRMNESCRPKPPTPDPKPGPNQQSQQQIADRISKYLRKEAGDNRFKKEETDDFAFSSKLKSIAAQCEQELSSLSRGTAMDIFANFVEKIIEPPPGFNVNAVLRSLVPTAIESETLTSPDVQLGIVTDIGVRLFFMIDELTRALFYFHNPTSIVEIHPKFLQTLIKENHSATRLTVNSIVVLLGNIRKFVHEFKYRMALNITRDMAIPSDEANLEKLLRRRLRSYENDVRNFTAKMYQDSLPFNLMQVAVTSSDNTALQQQLIALVQAMPVPSPVATAPTIYAVQPAYTHRQEDTQPASAVYHGRQDVRQPRSYHQDYSPRRPQHHHVQEQRQQPSYDRPPFQQYRRQPFFAGSQNPQNSDARRDGPRRPSQYTGSEADSWKHTVVQNVICATCGIGQHTSPAYCYLYKLCVAHAGHTNHTGAQCVSYLQFLSGRHIEPERATQQHYDELCRANSQRPKPHFQNASNSNHTQLGKRRFLHN
jgi:hypothetical protein